MGRTKAVRFFCIGFTLGLFFMGSVCGSEELPEPMVSEESADSWQYEPIETETTEDLVGREKITQEEYDSYQAQVSELEEQMRLEIDQLEQLKKEESDSVDSGMRELEALVPEIGQKRAYLRERAAQGEDIQEEQKALMEEEQALVRRAVEIKAQVRQIQNQYDQKIQDVRDSYQTQILKLRQDLMIEKEP